MALELEGKTFAMSKEQLEKYSTRMIFRVGLQFIRQNKPGMDLKPIENSMIHILNQYRYSIFDGNVRTPKGVMTWFTTKNYNEDNKRNEYYPARIEIGQRGYIESIDPELNFFLDNHPHNEIVKNDPNHANWMPNVESNFATYMAERRRDIVADTLQLSSKLTMAIFDKSKYNKEELVAVAEMVIRGANDYRIVHKLINLNRMADADVRTELARIASVYPYAMKEILESSKLDAMTLVNKFIDGQIVKMMSDEWVIVDKGIPGKAIMKIPSGQDAKACLVDWLKNFDTKGAVMRDLKSKLDAQEQRRKKPEDEPAK